MNCALFAFHLIQLTSSPSLFDMPIFLFEEDLQAANPVKESNCKQINFDLFKEDSLTFYQTEYVKYKAELIQYFRLVYHVLSLHLLL
ncbi:MULTISPECIES: hypothetical protein [unclassified Myroides]|uniref:hypothetical protein n=1 Tax=unclassified Myroides TaxID=2642485 RepID=UPI003D2F77CE